MKRGALWATYGFTFVALLGCTPAQSQVQTQQTMPPAKGQFSDNNGAPLSGGSAAFYVPGTLTPKTTWQDTYGTTVNPTIVPLDAGGRAFIYGNGLYRTILKDASGNTIWDGLTGTAFPTMIASNNLSDLTNKATALSNLGLGCPMGNGPNFGTPGQMIGVFASCFGVKADGVTDDTAAWNAAVAYMNSNPNTALIAPPGVSLASALTTITGTNGSITCPNGIGQCTLSLSGNPGVTFNGAHGGGLFNMRVDNRGVACATSVSLQNGSVGQSFVNVALGTNVGTFLQVGNGAGAAVGGITINGATVSGGGALASGSPCAVINVNGPGTGLSIINSTMATATGSASGRDFIDVALVGPNSWSNLSVENSYIGPFSKFMSMLYSGANALLSGVVVQGNFIVNCQLRCFDVNSGSGTTTGMNIVNNHIDGNSTADPCINVGGVSASTISIVNNQIGLCSGSGVVVGTAGNATRDVRITGNDLVQINTGATGTSFGINVVGSGNAGTLSGILVANNIVAPATVSSTKPDTGIAITSSPSGGTGATAWQISGNQALANTTNYAWPNGSTDVGQVLNNIGLATAGASVGVGSSGSFTYTAGARPTSLYLYNGNSVAVTTSTQLACNTFSVPSSCHVYLGPNESAAISWSGGGPGAPVVGAVQH